MRGAISAGAVAGLIGAVVPGLLFQFATTSASDGRRTSVIVMAAQSVRSSSPLAGWLVVLVYGVVAGALFGRLVRDRTLTAGLATIAGAFYGAGWWIVSGLVLAPALLGIVPLSPAAVDLMRPVALRAMIASVLYGAVLGAAVTVIVERLRRSQGPYPVEQRTTRAA